MNDFRIRADSFLLKKRRIRIYRVRHRNSGTVYWMKADAAIRYLTQWQTGLLRNKGVRHER